MGVGNTVDFHMIIVIREKVYGIVAQRWQRYALSKGSLVGLLIES